MLKLYNDVSFKISKLITHSYSTSFSIAVSFLNSEARIAIYSVYGFVRFADEIVDTFHDYDKQTLLSGFENEYYKAYRSGISLNPVLHSFQKTVRKYNIPDELIQAFLNSMKTDLLKKGKFSRDEINEYIYGSAEAVGLICLYVFVRGDKSRYNELKHPAMKLGAAFQKVNFLRDLGSDINDLGRSYFPELHTSSFNQGIKEAIIKDIEADFSESLPGIRGLPSNAKLPVLIAYYYYQNLLMKLRKTSAEELLHTRIRVNNFRKFFLFNKAYLAVRMRII